MKIAKLTEKIFISSEIAEETQRNFRERCVLR